MRTLHHTFSIYLTLKCMKVEISCAPDYAPTQDQIVGALHACTKYCEAKQISSTCLMYDSLMPFCGTSHSFPYGEVGISGLPSKLVGR